MAEEKRNTGKIIRKAATTATAAALAFGTIGVATVPAQAAVEPGSAATQGVDENNLNWTATFGDQTVPMTWDADNQKYVLAASLDTVPAGDLSQGITLTATDAQGVALTKTIAPAEIQHGTGFGAVGVSETTDTYRFDYTPADGETFPPVTGTITVVSARTGSEITLQDGTQFTENPDTGIWTAKMAGVQLNDDGTAPDTTVEYSNGQTQQVEWGPVKVREDGDRIVTYREGVANHTFTPEDTSLGSHEWSTSVTVEAATDRISWSAKYGDKQTALAVAGDGFDVSTEFSEDPGDVSGGVTLTGTAGDKTFTESVPTLSEEPSTTSTPGELPGVIDSVTESSAKAIFTPQPKDVIPAVNGTISVSYTESTAPITLDDGTGFSKTDDGIVATAAPVALSPDDTATRSTVEFSNGETADITWGGLQQKQEDGKTVTYREGVATHTFTDTATGFSWPVTVNVTASSDRSWTASIDGKTVNFTPDKDGKWSLNVDKATAYPGGTLEAVSSDGAKATLQSAPGKPAITADGVLGKAQVNGTVTYETPQTEGKNPDMSATVAYGYETGQELTIGTGDKAVNFTKTGDMFTATAPNIQLGDDNKPATNEILLSDGTKANVTWDEEGPQTVETDGAKIVSLDGVATGTVTVTDPATGSKVDEPYSITVKAARSFNNSVADLSYVQTRADGSTQTVKVPGFKDITDAAETSAEYTVEMPHDAVTDSFTLTAKTGADATKPNVTVQLGADYRKVAMEINGKAYVVTFHFAPADLVTENTSAALDGIFVNYTGENTQGELIENWDVNRLDYTIRVGEQDPSPYVLPVAMSKDIQIKPGEVSQTSDSTKQVWSVTNTKTGESRNYSVTVIREHFWKTAVEEFKPADPAVQEATVKPTDSKDAELVSHGYVDATGKYVPVDGDEYTIPEGGRFSYEAKLGQIASVNAIRTKGMTYSYTVTVLPTDVTAYAKQYTFTVTYLTAATQKAELSGILVDGAAVSGFDPAKHEYQVAVNDPNQWIVSPQYDKLTGMNVSTDKQGADATITVTSGDLQNVTVYKVHVTQKLFGGDGHVGMGGALAQTGVTAMSLAIGAIMAVAAGAVAIGASIMHGKSQKKDEETTAEAPDGVERQ